MDAKNHNRISKLIADVSIHAPVMDANSGILTPNEARAVSIHAPVMDANI